MPIIIYYHNNPFSQYMKFSCEFHVLFIFPNFILYLQNGNREFLFGILMDYIILHLLAKFTHDVKPLHNLGWFWHNV